MALDVLWRSIQSLRTKKAELKLAILEDLRGWGICLAVLIITVVRSGITYSFGVFVVELENTYHRPLAEQNWIGTLSFCISLSCAPVSVAFIRCLKYRGFRIAGLGGTIILTVSCLSSSFVPSLEWMFLTHSILYGVGSSLIYMASSLVIGDYFSRDHRFHVLATSILLCGYPVGSLLFNPINAWLVTSFGWRVAFRVASGMILVSGLICCWSFKAKDTPHAQRLVEEDESDIEEVNEVTEQKPGRKCCTISDIKARPEIMLWYLGNMLCYLGFYMPFLNLAYYMDLKHIQTTESSWALTLLSLCECVTYMIAAFLGDYLKGRLVTINIIATAFLSIICIIWPFVDVNYSVILGISLCMGGFLGLSIVYSYAASGEITQLPIDVAWSFTNMWSGVGILLGPFFSGFIYDFRKSYDDVFYVVGALYVLNAFIYGAIPAIQYYRRRKNGYDDLDENGGTHTFRVIKRSMSASSGGNCHEMAERSLTKLSEPAPDYGTATANGYADIR